VKSTPSRRALVAFFLAFATAAWLLGSAIGGETRKRSYEENVFPSVRSEVGPGWVDWTELKLYARTESLPEAGAYAARAIVEQKAMARLGPLMLDTAALVRITADTTAGDILESGSRLASLLDEDSSSWRVVETRYFTSGKIGVDGCLDIYQWLRPVLTSLESQAPAPAGMPSDYTGIIVDARGLKVEPALAPRLWSPSGEMLWGIQVLPTGTVKVRSPVGFVVDPADPRTCKRAGDNPLFVRATSVRDRVDLVLGSPDAELFQAARQDPRILSEARVILVLDP
jgi:hypothetical protein